MDLFRLQKKLKDNSFLFLLLIVFLAIWIALYSHFYQPFWDGAVYISNAKNIFSYGEIAYWESVRPIGWPIILGVFWKLGADLLVIGKILELLFSIGTISLVYLISKQLFNKKIADIAAVIITFNSLFIFWTFKLYTSIPATFFFLLSLYFFTRKQNVYAGIFSFIAVMVRYPIIFLIVPLEIYLLYRIFKQKKNLLSLVYYNIPILLGIIAFFIFNHYKYSSWLGPVYVLISSTGWGSSPLFFPNNSLLYLGSFPLFLHIMLPFLFFGIYLLFKEKLKNKEEIIFLILLPLIILYAFFQIISMKDERYILPLIPLIAIISAYGLSKIRPSVRKTILIAYMLISIGLLMIFPATHHMFFPDMAQNQSIVERCPFDAKIAASTPLAVIYWYDYFPFFSSREEAMTRFSEVMPDVQCVFHTSCDFTGKFPEDIILEEYELIYQDENYCRNSVYAK
ncbi:MAG: glycosyltransferase family 39 protein [Nanoarchaeota archaeon]|nr:glycosyltransferase family 39 protein [Nanoarchaeota archaeon]